MKIDNVWYINEEKYKDYSEKLILYERKLLVKDRDLHESINALKKYPIEKKEIKINKTLLLFWMLSSISAFIISAFLNDFWILTFSFILSLSLFWHWFPKFFNKSKKYITFKF